MNDIEELYINAKEIYKQYEKLNFQYVKLNILQIMKDKKIKRHSVSTKLEIDYVKFGNMLNISKGTTIPFTVLMDICIFLKVNIMELNAPIERKSKENFNKRWTDENIKLFMQDVETITLQEVTEKWGLKGRSIQIKYDEFKKLRASYIN